MIIVTAAVYYYLNFYLSLILGLSIWLTFLVALAQTSLASIARRGFACFLHITALLREHHREKLPA